MRPTFWPGSWWYCLLFYTSIWRIVSLSSGSKGGSPLSAIVRTSITFSTVNRCGPLWFNKICLHFALPSVFRCCSCYTFSARSYSRCKSPEKQAAYEQSMPIAWRDGESYSVFISHIWCLVKFLLFFFVRRLPTFC